MSFGNHTPEALLARSDSKDPATTCKGLTTTGRPCRRALAASASNSPAASPNAKGNGVVAILDDGDAAAFFCWQHKDQADALIAEISTRTRVLPLKEKNSIDTLIERIGVIHLEDEVGGEDAKSEYRDQRQSSDKNRHRHISGSRRHGTLPPEWQRINGPLMRVPEDVVQSHTYIRPKQRPRSTQRDMPEKRVQSNVKASWGCCVRADDDDLPPPRRTANSYDDRRTEPGPRSNSRRKSEPVENMHRRPVTQDLQAPVSQRRRPVSNPVASQQAARPVNLSHSDSPSTPKTARPCFRSQSSLSPPNSQTSALLALIPAHLSPTTTSALLSELSKPISSADEEGYIYIFWLTPESDASKPDDETASSLLDWDYPSPASSPLPRSAVQSNGTGRTSDMNRRNAQNRLTAQALQRFASVKRSSSEPQKILLKIGRASNVHRRLSQWTKQCGQNITLIRYYPYVSSCSDSGTNGENRLASMRRKVPHVHRVERLIHLELADQRVADKGKCEQCSREHKEWFEVEATRDGVAGVDEVVRRWVNWTEGRA